MLVTVLIRYTRSDGQHYYFTFDEGAKGVRIQISARIPWFSSVPPGKSRRTFNPYPANVENMVNS